jgi:hypothetical protein
MKRRRHVWVGLTLVVLLTAMAVYFFAQRMRVSVVNKGPGPLHDVVVHVTGCSYPVGDIPSESSATVAVQATSESHVEIEFTSSSERRRLVADCYFESDWHGHIEVDVRDGRIERVRKNIRLPLEELLMW